MSKVLPDISLAALAKDPQVEIESLVRQLNEWGRLITNAVNTLKSESYITMHYWFGSSKLQSDWTDLPGSVTDINFDDWALHSWYWETVLFTDAGTGYARLYNVTDSEAVAGTEFSTTATGEDNAVQLRTEILSKYLGTKQFKVQVKIVGGNGTTEYVNCVKSNIIFKVET